METIRHLLVIDGSVDTVYRALTEQTGLSGWWTTRTVAVPVVGSHAEFSFGDRYHNVMRIASLEENRRVRWECLEGDDEWVGTTLEFDLEPDGDRTIVRFRHGNWGEATDFFASCNTNWGFYMQSLKSYCETGAGEPFTDTS